MASKHLGGTLAEPVFRALREVSKLNLRETSAEELTHLENCSSRPRWGRGRGATEFYSRWFTFLSLFNFIASSLTYRLNRHPPSLGFRSLSFPQPFRLCFAFAC